MFKEKRESHRIKMRQERFQMAILQQLKKNNDLSVCRFVFMRVVPWRWFCIFNHTVKYRFELEMFFRVDFDVLGILEGVLGLLVSIIELRKMIFKCF
jgi:hypothetical protein